jgi:membrane protein YqaA with SNARE-associated domain
VSSSAAYLSLFSAAFLAATIIPAQSEVGLSALILTTRHNVVLLVIVAATGNVLGAVVNWHLGRWINRFSERRWFPIKPERLTRATRLYRKYGRWSLLFSWVPFIGDPITVAAGVLREPLFSFLLIVGFAKTTRYILVAAITLKLI